MDLSIIIPIYKGSKYLKDWLDMIERNIECLDKNSLTVACELIFVNDFPDEEIVVDEESRKKINIRIYNLPQNKGIHGARVFGYKRAKGKYIVFLDQDDKITDNYIASQIQCIGENDAVVCNGYKERFCRTGKRLIYGSDKQQKDAILLETCIQKGCKIISPGQVMIRKAAIPMVWLNNIMQVNCADDYFLWIAMLKEDKKLKINADILYTHIGNGNNVSSDLNNMNESIEEMLKILETNNLLSREEGQIIRARKKTFNEGKFLEMITLYDYWLYLKINNRSIEEFLLKNNYRKIAIYGMNYIGSRLYDDLKESAIEVAFGIDRDANCIIHEVPIYDMDGVYEDISNVDVIVVTAVAFFSDIEKAIKQKYSIPVVSMKDILIEMCGSIYEKQR